MNTNLFNQTTNQIKEELYYDNFDNEVFEKMTDDDKEIQFLSELRYEMLKRNYYGEMLYNCDEYDDKHLKNLHKIALSLDVFDEDDDNSNEKCILKYFNIFNYFKSKVTTKNKIKMSEELENEILKDMMIRRNIEVSMIPFNYLLEGYCKIEPSFINELECIYQTAHNNIQYDKDDKTETIYDNEYYEKADKQFHELFVEASTNLFLEDCKNERYDEINNIRDNLTHYNYFYRVYKAHYKRNYIYNWVWFPIEVFNYINKIDKCLFNKLYKIKYGENIMKIHDGDKLWIQNMKNMKKKDDKQYEKY